MGKKKIEIYACDNCGVERLKPFVCNPEYTINMICDYVEGPGPSVYLKNLCESCHVIVGKAFENFIEKIKRDV